MIEAMIVALNAILIFLLVSMFCVILKNNGVFPSGSITIKYRKNELTDDELKRQIKEYKYFFKNKFKSI